MLLEASRRVWALPSVYVELVWLLSLNPKYILQRKNLNCKTLRHISSNVNFWRVFSRPLLNSFGLTAAQFWKMPQDFLDMMHDWFEGVVQHEMKMLIIHCLDEKFF